MNLTPLADVTFLGVPAQHTPRCASTMDIVTALAAEGAPVGTCVVTDDQTAGRGRAGRTWIAPPGTSILLSALLRPHVPPGRLGQISILLAVVIARLVEANGIRPAAIKWPNDVLVGGAKVSGVLANARILPEDDPVVVVGVGLNVNITPDALPPGATSLLALTGEPHDRGPMLRSLLDGLETAYWAFEAGDTEAMWHEANERLAFRGENAQVVEGDRTFSGTVLGLTRSGALRLGLPDGTEQEIWSGDLVRGPRPVNAPNAPA